MLNKKRRFFSQHFQAASTSFNHLWNNPLPTLMTTIVIAITLALPLLFWVITANLQHMTSNWQGSGQISLYLTPSSTDKAHHALLTKLRLNPEIGNAVLISPEQGLVELQSQEGMANIMDFLPDNPLPAVIQITPALKLDTPFKLQRLHQQLEKLPHVEQAKLDMEWVNRFHAMLKLAAKLTHAVMVLLGMAVLLIIGNTLRLAIHNRQEEIQVLKLVGATDPFILRPFLYFGMWYGLIGALLALFLVDGFLWSLSRAADQLAAMYSLQYSLHGLSLQQALLLLISAIILGWLGARLSVKRQLAFIEPSY